MEYVLELGGIVVVALVGLYCLVSLVVYCVKLGKYVSSHKKSKEQKAKEKNQKSLSKAAKAKAKIDAKVAKAKKLYDKLVSKGVK